MPAQSTNIKWKLLYWHDEETHVKVQTEDGLVFEASIVDWSCEDSECLTDIFVWVSKDLNEAGVKTDEDGTYLEPYETKWWVREMPRFVELAYLQAKVKHQAESLDRLQELYQREKVDRLGLQARKAQLQTEVIELENKLRGVFR